VRPRCLHRDRVAAAGADERCRADYRPLAVRGLQAYLRWRNANNRHPDVLAAQRRERARVRSEKGLRWGGRRREDLALAA
jgi:hypothetical protein